MSEQDAIQRAGASPATLDSLTQDLAVLGVKEGSILLVHSSLSSLGWVCGGAIAVIEALKKAIGKTGTLVMPTHSGELSDPSQWENPPVPEHWWPVIRAEMPPYDAHLTPTRGMGVIPDSFRHQSGVIRSNHPQVSFAACGPFANHITENHQLEDGLGDKSPLGHLYQLQAWVLLLGVGYDRNTSLHLSEIHAFGEHIPKLRQAAPIKVSGQRKWVEFMTADVDGSDFPRIGDAFEQQTAHVKTGKVAAATAWLMPQPALVDFGEAWMRQHRHN
jgi:aminoglycoside 3-N-acetyltransferase